MHFAAVATDTGSSRCWHVTTWATQFYRSTTIGLKTMSGITTMRIVARAQHHREWLQDRTLLMSDAVERLTK